jgi:hypothetical protein
MANDLLNNEDALKTASDKPSDAQSYIDAAVDPPLDKDDVTTPKDDKEDAENEEDEDEKEAVIKPAIYYVASMNPDDLSIKIKLLPMSKPVPAMLLSFIGEIGTVENSIHALLVKKTEIKRLMQELYGVAKVGGTSTYFNLANANLEQMKSEMIVSIGNKIKYRYLVYYAKCAATVVLACLLLLACLDIFNIQRLGIISPILLINALLMLIGTSMGAWLTFAIQKREVTFQELRVLNDHTTSTKIKLGVILTISVCLFLMFITGFLSIKIGNQFSTDSLKRAGGRNFSFVLGAMIGLSESKIGITLTSKIETLMAKI